MARTRSEMGRPEAGRPVGAYDTGRMVGREALKDRVLSLFDAQDERPAVVFLTGEGGIGKTRFLHDLLETTKTNPDVASMDELVDLYHVVHHTPEGLARAIWDTFPAAQKDFWTYERERELFQQMRLAGDLRRINEQRRRTLDAFAQGLRDFSAQQKVLLTLDTAERAVYSGRHQEGLHSYEVAESWRWLAEILPSCANLVLVVSGRAQALALKDILPGPSVHVHEEGVHPFSPDESLEYFQALVETAREKGDAETARNIEALGEDVLQNLHHYAGGLPILLALFVDLLAVSGPEAIPDELRRDPRLVEDAEPGPLRNWLEKEVIGRLIFSPLGDTIRALGRTPKGADAELLARLRGIEREQAERELAGIRGLSFVKTRPMDDCVFLHDVLYDMLGRHIYDGPHDEPEAQAAAAAIDDYYKDRLDHVHREMHALLQPILDQQQSSLEIDELDAFTSTRQSLLAERVFYLLRRDFARGFEFYYRYAHETIFSGQVLLDLLLQAEFVACWAERSEASGETEVDVPPATVETAIAIRPVARMWAAGEYEEAIHLAAQVRRDRPDLFSEAETVNLAVLNMWESLSHIYLGTQETLHEAHRLLDESIAQLEQARVDLGRFPDSTQTWWVKTMLTSALRGRGYLHWSQGHLRRSAQDYRRAARLGRDVNVLVELARTLNDLGFTLAEQGEWATARSLVKDALDIQQRFGLYTLAALSVNTLALIAIREGEYASAAERSQTALNVFRTMQFRRGIGLALTALAEAHRRRAGRSTIWSPDRKIGNLRQARDWAREAVDIFREEGEVLRQVEALIEVGCACRDWVRIRKEHPNWRDNVERLYREAMEALEEAAALASEQYLYRHVDALVNLAWLHFYAGEEDALEKAITEAEKAFPPEYLFDKSQGKPTVAREDAVSLLWTQLGKLYTLKGVHGFDQYRSALQSGDTHEGGRHLQEAARSFTLGLEYSGLVGQEYQGLIQAEDIIYDLIKRAHTEALEAIAKAAVETEEEYHFEQAGMIPSMMRRFLEERALWYDDGGREHNA